MFSSSQFDATSAFSGGGFMSSQPSQLNDSSPAPSKSRETQGLVPVTVKQISEATQSGDEKSNFVINGVDLNNVTLVGMVFEKVERNTDVNFVLDDGTGRIKCRRWVNETFDTKEMEEEWHVRSCLWAFEKLSRCQATCCLLCQACALDPFLPVTNFDEIPFHFIDCIHNHLRSKVKVEGITSANPSSGSSFNTPIKNAPNGSQAPSSNPAYAQYSMDGLKDYDKLVIDYLQQHSDMSDERGIHVNELSRELKLPLDKIMLSLKTLGDDGLVYSTIDDYHYKQA
ncbi:Replication protein A 32 kDa subunit A [Mucuna pruriens]|uniref:Replication protein A 32 kDa subunit A n=1 Tax=Mucuna pruriens TaxID=157652 RepID=A0A371F4H7_MUCPR|nr:Replication protein A 32 kDa subunit A [Mucuna pruriens]